MVDGACGVDVMINVLMEHVVMIGTTCGDRRGHIGETRGCCGGNTCMCIPVERGHEYG